MCVYIYIYICIYSRFVCSKQTAAPTTGTRPPFVSNRACPSGRLCLGEDIYLY